MADVTFRRPVSAWTVTALDIAERVVLTLLFVRMAVVNFGPIVQHGQWFNAMVLFSEGLVVALVMLRRSSDVISVRPADWLFAFFATAAPLLVRPGGGAPLVPPLLGFILLFTGTGVQLAAKLMLRRSFGIVPANRGIKIEGPYRLIRHPMYLGYVTVHIGFLLMAPNPFNLCVYGLSFAGQIYRILAEERLLMRDPDYVAFAKRVRWRLVPGLF